MQLRTNTEPDPAEVTNDDIDTLFPRVEAAHATPEQPVLDSVSICNLDLTP